MILACSSGNVFHNYNPWPSCGHREVAKSLVRFQITRTLETQVFQDNKRGSVVKKYP